MSFTKDYTHKETTREINDLFFQPKTESIEDVLRWKLGQKKWEDLSEKGLEKLKATLLEKISRRAALGGKITEDGCLQFTYYDTISAESAEEATRYIIADETKESKILALYNEVKDL